MVLSGITPPMEGRQIEHREICKKAEMTRAFMALALWAACSRPNGSCLFVTLFAFDQARRQEAFLRRKQIA